MRVDHSRDDNLTDFGKATLSDRYLLPGESYQDLFARVAKFFSNDQEHADRIYKYISNLWFMPATPVLSNGGSSRGLSISCFLSESTDNMTGIVDNWVENTWLACLGGGIGTYWGNVRSIGESIGKVGKSSGVIPFIRVQDSLTLAISQGSLRRGSAAVYMPINHPEIEEFIEIRRPTGGDPNRKALNLHNAVAVDDIFMNAVRNDGDYDLISPATKRVVKTVKARSLWIRILTARIETGEPYILFRDTVNAAMPEHQKKLGLSVKTSNLCTEITLPTGIDHLGKNRTAVCCLSSLNLEKYDEWKDDDQFIIDVMYFLDNVLQDFIDNAPDTHAKAKYSAMRERSVGLGVMGLHSYYQSKGIAFESEQAAHINEQMIRYVSSQVQLANREIAFERGDCPDAIDASMTGIRFSTAMAIAPTASISIICGGTSAGIEPIMANVYTHKTLSGSFNVKNKYLQRLLKEYGMDTQEVWSTIMNDEGSVQNLDFMLPEHKAVFRTAFEIDQRQILRQAAERQPFVDQAQSINVFLRPDISKKELHDLHFTAWEIGLKSLYYCRSKSLQRADKPSVLIKREKILDVEEHANKYEVCEACQ